MDTGEPKTWKRQRPFKIDPSKRLSPEEVYLMASQMSDPCLKSLFALTYISGCRISELIRYDKLHFDTETYTNEKGKIRTRYLWKSKQIIESHPSILKKQLQFVMEEDTPVLLISIRNLKNRTRHIKEIPINLSKEWNIKFVEIIKEYISSKQPDEELFPLSRNQVEYRFRKLPFNLHYLRDLRATHYAVFNDMSEGQLTRIMGWTDSRPASTYIQYKWKDLVKKT